MGDSLFGAKYSSRIDGRELELETHAAVEATNSIGRPKAYSPQTPTSAPAANGAMTSSTARTCNAPAVLPSAMRMPGSFRRAAIDRATVPKIPISASSIQSSKEDQSRREEARAREHGMEPLVHRQHIEHGHGGVHAPQRVAQDGRVVLRLAASRRLR